MENHTNITCEECMLNYSFKQKAHKLQMILLEERRFEYLVSRIGSIINEQRAQLYKELNNAKKEHTEAKKKWHTFKKSKQQKAPKKKDSSEKSGSETDNTLL